MVIFSKNKKNTEKKKHGKIVCTKMNLEKKKKISHTPPQSRKIMIRPLGKILRVNNFSSMLVVNQL